KHLLGFLDRRVRVAEGSPWSDREARVWVILRGLLGDLAAAHEAHFDPPWTIDDLAAAARRWIQQQTFEPDALPDAEVHLIDDQAARFGLFDDITLVGLVDKDWPERPHRNIFYPPSLLKALGWPSEHDRRRAETARFLDLLRSAS